MAESSNEIAQIQGMLETMQTRMNESDKKIELTATTLQMLIKSTPKEKGDKPYNWGGEYHKKKKGKTALLKSVHE